MNYLVAKLDKLVLENVFWKYFALFRGVGRYRRFLIYPPTAVN